MGSDYDEIMDRFRKDIISDKAPDMIYTHDRNIIKMYAKQGVYMDLYQCFENDSDLKTEELLPNVLSACETDGKLYSISPGFTVNTMIASEKIVDIENWNVNDMIKISDSLPENMSFFENNRRDDILDIMIYLFSEEINVENNTCNFNKKEIKDFMSFAEKLDLLNNCDNIDQDDNNFNSSIDIVLSQLHIYNFRSYLIDTVSALGQREPCIVGYPTLNGKGGSLEFQCNLAILNNSQNKDLCWDFIKGFFEDEEISDVDGISSFPTKISLFDKIVEESMHSSVFVDEYGKETIKPLIANYKGDFIEVEPFTENEKDKLVEYIKSINHEGMSIRKNIRDVLIDEIYPWLYGKNSSEELLQNLQSRISILLNE